MARKGLDIVGLPSVDETIQGILKNSFGYSAFRDVQKDVILNCLAGKDSFVLMPTGAGKSLCFQVPALAFPGVTLVVSPLIALMQDQVTALKKKKIAAEYLNSEMKDKDRARVYADLKSKSPATKLLYVTPELIGTSGFQYILSGMFNANKLSCFAVDEAHCISKWGVQFRPKYRNLCVLRTKYPTVPIMALTATATKSVQEDILQSLSLKSPKTFAASFNRANISYQVCYKELIDDVIGHIAEFIQTWQVSGSGIIYCHKRQDCEDVASSLSALGLSVKAYHAGMPVNEKKETLDKWTSGKIQVVTATVAFGMGIDKANVRFVIHHTMSKSMEEFYQESGRAGRDGNEAFSIVYYSERDRGALTYLISNAEEAKEKGEDTGTDAEKSVKVAQEAFAKVVDFCMKPQCRRQQLMAYFGEEGVQCNRSCDYCEDPVLVRAQIAELGKTTGQSCLNGLNLGTSISSYQLPGREQEKRFTKSTEVLKTISAPQFKIGDDNDAFFAAFRSAEKGSRGGSRSGSFSAAFPPSAHSTPPNSLNHSGEVGFTTANKLRQDASSNIVGAKATASKKIDTFFAPKASSQENSHQPSEASGSDVGFVTSSTLLKVQSGPSKATQPAKNVQSKPTLGAGLKSNVTRVGVAPVQFTGQFSRPRSTSEANLLTVNDAIPGTTSTNNHAPLRPTNSLKNAPVEKKKENARINFFDLTRSDDSDSDDNGMLVEQSKPIRPAVSSKFFAPAKTTNNNSTNNSGKSLSPSKKRDGSLLQATPTYKRGKFEVAGSGRDISYSGFEYFSDEIIDDDFESAAFALRKGASTDVLNQKKPTAPEQKKSVTGRSPHDPLDFMFQ